MEPIVLHHYDLSPFSEKIRRVLAYKGVPWRAVVQPIMAPKPDLTPLTGGYRRIPVMQIGADIYCDTALIVRRLDELVPTPTVIPPALAGAIAVIEDWADHRLFMQVVPPVLVELLPVLPPEFLEDRSAMSKGFSREVVTAAAPAALEQTLHSFDYLEAALSKQPYLLGDAFTLADAACFHPVWFVKNNPKMFEQVRARAGLAAWVQRIDDFGPGKVTAMTGAAALELAGECVPADLRGDSVTDAGYKVDDMVSIVADDYGLETTTGRVMRVRRNDVTVLRDDATLGEVAVHYPRAGYRIKKLA